MDFPSSWDELKPSQVRHIWKLQDRCLRNDASPLEFNILVLFRLLGFRPVFRKRPADKFHENVYMLCEQCLGFLFSKDGVTLQYNSLADPLKHIGIRKGPGNMLRSLTFGEFRHASVALQEYASCHDAKALDECIAILYRTPWKLNINRAGRRISPPGSFMFKLDLIAARHTAFWKKALAFSWFCHTLQYLQNGKLVIDGEIIDFSLLFSGPDKDTMQCSWNDLLVQLARDGILGNIDRVDEEPLMSVFSIMWSNYKESKRYEKALKASKPK